MSKCHICEHHSEEHGADYTISVNGQSVCPTCRIEQLEDIIGSDDYKAASLFQPEPHTEHYDDKWQILAQRMLGMMGRNDVADGLDAEVVRRETVINKLPKCWRLDESGKRVRDVPVVPGMKLWFESDTGEIVSDNALQFVGNTLDWVSLNGCSDTREAAEAGRKEAETDGSSRGRHH